MGTSPVCARWAIVLAGGEGQRLQSFVHRHFGKNIPKQYCSLVENCSMLETTVRRARNLVPEEQIITIIGQGHEKYLDGKADRLQGRIIEQPINLDTAPGIFFPATYAYAANPDAIILIFPSDHYLAPESKFLVWMEKAARLAESLSDRIVLLGAQAERAETDYGWIEPGSEQLALSDGSSCHCVARFHEKPTEEKAKFYYHEGYLWNTMIMAVKLKALWQMGYSTVPDMMQRFDAFRSAIGTSAESTAVPFIHNGMKKANFSRDILEKLPQRIAVLRMEGVEWSDLGRPERVEEVLNPNAPTPRTNHPIYHKTTTYVHA